MPSVKENLSTVTIDAQHASYLAILFEVERVIPIELDWISGSGCARDVHVEVFLGIFNCLFRAYSHLGRDITRNSTVPVVAIHHVTHHPTVAAHHATEVAHHILVVKSAIFKIPHHVGAM